jgi:HD-like signal output (HDOD) protein
MQTILASKKGDPNLLPFRFALKAYIADERLKIPVLPDVVSQVIGLINHPNADANTLARLIHKDQALAGYVLRVSNSPIFAGSREITTLRQAIARIGAKTLGKIALSVTMQGKVFKADGYEVVMKDVWRQSLTAGAFAQEIGKMINDRNESLYLCGLLHSVGKPVILQALEDLRCEFDMELSFEGGIALMDEFHRVVGRKVAEQWKLSEPVRHACIHYLEPEKSDGSLKEVRITFLAYRLAKFIDVDPTEDDLLALADNPSTAALRLKEKHMIELASRLPRIRAVLEAMSGGM